MRQLSPTGIAIAAALIAALLVGLALRAADWNPTVFAGFGEEAGPTTDYAEQRLDDVLLRPELGHDGRFFFVQANDPWILDPAGNAAILDLPNYRSQRMLYPLLAGGFGLLDATAVIWGLLVVNLVAMAAGAWATSSLALNRGESPLWGLAFVANIGLLYSLTSDTAGVVAAALAMCSVVMMERDRPTPGVAFLTGAVLTRETMILCAVGLAVWLWLDGKRRAALHTIVVPAVAIGYWVLYLRARLSPDDESPDALSLPFVGLAEAIPEWLEDPIVFATGIVLMALMLLYLLHWAHSRSALAWAFIGFIPLAMVMSRLVWTEIFDFTRALAPWLTAALLVIFAERPRQKDSKRLRELSTG